MSVRLIVGIKAAPGKGAELLKAMEARSVETRKEPGCEQFEVFQSGHDPDNLCLIELWADQAALDVHAGLIAKRPADPAMDALRAGGPATREDYEYNRTR